MDLRNQMENQHRLIKTYRELTQAEIDLMNECKVFEAQFHLLKDKIFNHLQDQALAAMSLDTDSTNSTPEMDRFHEAKPYRWLAIAETHVEQGMMALVRSVAQPSTPKLENTDV